MKTIQEITNMLKEEIEQKFSTRPNSFETAKFIRKMRIKASNLISSEMNLSPLYMRNNERFNAHAESFTAFLIVTEFLEEKSDQYYDQHIA